MTTPDEKVILYPAGGCFNRMRSEQTYLNDLLMSSFDGWEKAENKKSFVCEMILGKIPGGIWIYDRDSAQAVRPEKKDAENRILQKMRDLKKSLNKGKSGSSATSMTCSLDGDDTIMSVATTSSAPRRTNRKPKPASKTSKKAIAVSKKKKMAGKDDGKEKTYFEYVMDDAYETEETATDVSSPESQSSDKESPTEVVQLREEVKFLQTLCMDQKRHIRWLKNKITSLKQQETKENDVPYEQ